MQMHHRKYENSRSVDTVEQAVGEPARDGSSDAAANDLMLQRVLPNPVEKRVSIWWRKARPAGKVHPDPSSCEGPRRR
jgi:hypothetical protein